MQCPSCSFRNLPGSGRCARCGGVLMLAGAAIDVHPPRATALQKSLTAAGLWSFRALGRRVRERFSSAWHFAGVRAEATARLDLPTVLRCLVPGWANAHAGRRTQGYSFLAAYAALLLPGLMMIGTNFGAMLLGVAFGIHSWSAVTALVPRFDSYRDRLVFTGMSGLLLAFLLYLPIGTVAAQFATPLNINLPMPLFSTGDVVWYHPTTTVRPGQLALYDSRGLQAAIRGGPNAQLIVQPGLRINRVVAVEGQTVSWENGRMLVDQNPTPRKATPAESTDTYPPITVPAGSVLIDPANLIPPAAGGETIAEVYGRPISPVGINAGVWQELALVPVDRLRGVVFYRSWPFSRAGFVD